MKKQQTLLLALVCTVLPAFGQVTINIELGSSTAVTNTDVAGVVPSAGWQLKSGFPDISSPSALNLSDGSSSGATITIDGTGNLTSIGASTTNANYTMFNRNLGIGAPGSSNVGGGPGSRITVTGLGTAFTAGGYDVYVYVAANINNTTGGADVSTISVGDGTTTYYLNVNDTVASYQGSFIQATATVPANSVIANYVKFSGLTSASFTITGANTTSNVDSVAGFAGIQIVPVPEPAAYAAIVAGLCLLLVVARRRAARA